MSQAWSEYMPDAEPVYGLRHAFRSHAARELTRHFESCRMLRLCPKRPINPTHPLSYSARLSISEVTA